MYRVQRQEKWTLCHTNKPNRDLVLKPVQLCDWKKNIDKIRSLGHKVDVGIASFIKLRKGGTYNPKIVRTVTLS